jgi:predicted Zn-dependent peptidase
MTFINSQDNFRQTRRADGLRILTESRADVPSATLGIWIDAGSVYENDDERGLAHMLEHIVFKGTTRRSMTQLAAEMDALGGHTNAFTERELVCYHVKVLSEHLPRALDLLADLLTHPTMESDAIEVERGVILEEINGAEDAPEEYIEDLFTETIWKKSRWGRPILGTKESVSALQAADLRRFMATHYTPQNIVVAAAGDVDHERVVKLCERAFRDLPQSAASTGHATPPAPRVAQNNIQVTRETEQVHLCCGTRGTNYNDPKRFASWLLDSILTGGYSSRLFQEIREKRGLCYSIGPFSASYRRAGFWGVSTSVAPEEASRVVELIGKELRRIKEKPVGKAELKRAQEMMRINVLLAEESSAAQMSRIARNELYYGRQKSTDEVLSDISSVTAEQIQALANEMFDPRFLNLAAIGPFEKDAPQLKLEV